MTLQENFHETISTKNKVLEYYQKLYFTHNHTNLYTSEKNNITSNITATNISLFPSYIQPEFNLNTDVEIIKIPQKKIIGYAILIKGHTDLETLFKTEYKKSFRANILRFVNKFEACFNANYKLFFGDITEEEYVFLMAKLHNMLTKRFDQRNDSNKVLTNWNLYLDTTYNLIKEKKASLFVIYNNTTPVHICINHHFNNILFVSVPSYDINYAKFALGNISLYKLLEWSVNNNYEVMDMAQGYLEYKRRWSNLFYEFDHHIIYTKKNTLGHISALIEIQKLYFKNFLKSKNIDTFIEKIKKQLRKKNVYSEEINYQLENTQLTNKSTKTIINIYSDVFNFLIIPINDFLYINKEHLDDLKVFEIIKDKEYLLQGKQINQKLIIR